MAFHIPRLPTLGEENGAASVRRNTVLGVPRPFERNCPERRTSFKSRSEMSCIFGHRRAVLFPFVQVPNGTTEASFETLRIFYLSGSFFLQGRTMKLEAHNKFLSCHKSVLYCYRESVLLPTHMNPFSFY